MEHPLSDYEIISMIYGLAKERHFNLFDCERKSAEILLAQMLAYKYPEDAKAGILQAEQEATSKEEP